MVSRERMRGIALLTVNDIGPDEKNDKRERSLAEPSKAVAGFRSRDENTRAKLTYK